MSAHFTLSWKIKQAGFLALSTKFKTKLAKKEKPC
jgi:hypothetical protein